MARTDVCGKVSTIVLAAMSHERALSHREIQAELAPITLNQVRDAVKYQCRLGRVEAHGWGEPAPIGNGARRSGQGARLPIRWRLRA